MCPLMIFNLLTVRFNDARWLYESTEVSFDAYRIIHESSPIQQGGFFHYLIPYDVDGNIISPIAKLELNTPREQSSGGLFIRGTSYILLSPPAVVRKLIFPSPLHQNNEGESKTKKIACKRKRKLINVKSKPSFCMEIYFTFQDKVTYKKTKTTNVAEATAVTNVAQLTLTLLYYIALSYIIVVEWRCPQVSYNECYQCST